MALQLGQTWLVLFSRVVRFRVWGLGFRVWVFVIGVTELGFLEVMGLCRAVGCI